MYDTALVPRWIITVIAAFFLYLLLGAVAGVLAGLFGIGGGLIIVPVLIFSFQAQGLGGDVMAHLAVGTSLAAIVFTSLSSIRTHHAKGAVRWDLFRPMAVGIVFGTAFGVLTVAGISGPMLQNIIGIFTLVIAVKMGFALSPTPGRNPPAKPGLAGVGGVIGWASALFGIGGGSLVVPFLTYCNVGMRNAVATSAACGLPIAVAGALANMVVGQGQPGLPPYAVGYVYLPAVVGIVLTSVPFARLGALLAHRLSPVLLRRTFALLLTLIGIRFLLA
ncbi:sulfite exporter TauE/SafE family protein [Hydrocarboniclastica marina]|uniref:sulfite exporter TauE/SafE family protein n=1 Tax=Hydrocarboniclastica marina TaxID=2259620 RepID=UPI001FE75F83|nr:sulfite exporter TauE/SafE family protein [Hydrocarboniclastica marina]